MIYVFFVNNLIYVDLLNHRCRVPIIEHSLRLVNLSSILSYAVELTWLHRFVILGKGSEFNAKVLAHNCTAISNVDYVDVIIDYHDHNGTRSSSVDRSLLLFSFSESPFEIFIEEVEEVIISFVSALDYGVMDL